METWASILLLASLANCQLHSHLVPPLQDSSLGHQTPFLGHVHHPGQTQAIIRNTGQHAFGNRQRASITVHGPNPGPSGSIQIQTSASQIVPIAAHQPRPQGSAQQQILLQQQGFPDQSATSKNLIEQQAPILAQSSNVSHNVSQAAQNLSQQAGQSLIDQVNGDVKNHALFYRSTNSSPTNKYHRAREDLSRAYLPAELSSTQEPRPFQTQKYSPQSTTPASNNYGGNNQSPRNYGQTTPRQNVFPSTPGYQLQASQQKGTGYQSNNPQGYSNTKQPSGTQRGYQQPFQPQGSYSPAGQDKPTKAYIPPQPSYQPPTQQDYQPSQSSQGYQPSQPGYQSTQQGTYQPNQQGYQPSTQQGYQPSTPQGYQPSTQQGYQPSGQTQQSYQPSSTPRPSYQPQTSSTPQPSYSSTSFPTAGPTQQGGYSPSGPTGQPSGAIGPSTTYSPADQGYPAPSKPPTGLPDGPGYPAPVNTVQPPFFTEGDNQITGSYPNQGSQPSSAPSGGTQTPSTSSGSPGGSSGFRPGEAGNPQNVGQHPPHIHELNVQCSKESMTVNIEFNEPFNGVIYSKGHHNEPDCRYVQPNSGSTKFSFTLNLNSCGTQYIEDFASGNPAYLENTLVIQNEPGILEIWDYIRNVKCLWEGSITQSLSTGLSIDGLNQEVVTFSGDTAKAKLELQAGRGPFSYENVNLVRIGDLMTLVITVEGDNGFNIRVGECIATDGQPNTFNRISLTDDRGCTIKDKVMGAFQFTRNPNSGASVAYAFFRAFKFPDVMELAIECSVQLCKTECAPCPDPNQLIEPRRRRRWVQNVTEEIFEELRLKNKIQVFLPEDLPSSEMSFSSRDENQICITPSVFYSTTSLLLILTSVSTLAWMYFWYKAMSVHRKH